MDRVAESNHNTGFAYFVEKVLLFGSYLRRAHSDDADHTFRFDGDHHSE
jgi:hypothetical protein